MSNKGQQVTDVDGVVTLINAAMVRLLIGNDWFGDNQIREVILDEFNAVRRTLTNQGWAVIDKPFNLLLERLNPDEPLAEAVRYELKSIRTAFNANNRPVQDYGRESRASSERVGS